MSDRIELTNREYATLRGIASGLTVRQVAARMLRSEMTLYRDLEKLRHKLGADTNLQLVDRAWRVGVLDASTPLMPYEQPAPEPASVAVPPALIAERRRILVGGQP